ncbi:MAG: OmpH family outer membrane protein [Glaciecola sp.]|jgi:outer membrane protein|uniref:OmpH family outer membrane protein n=1 Tax=Glaciecola sp. HTCC2999 TaxID=455436 RepID=UPI0000E0E618|nr:OmpH family outer membrane protein [Glaciecola sp. HTCC2999]MCH1414488.1 OmpH family outer membrane protein [Glaciecola sp.]
MKTITKTLATTALIASTLFSTAVMAAQKVAIVDVQGILQVLPQTAQIAQSINEEFKEQYGEIQKLQKDGEFEVEKLQRDGATMSEAQKQASQEKIMAIRAELQEKAQPLQQAVQRRQNEEQTKLLGLVKQAIDAVAQAESFDMVLNANAVTFVKPEFDISQKVLQQVNTTTTAQ